MRRDGYQYTFKKPDGEVISETNLVASALRPKLMELFKEHYDFNYNATPSALYDLVSRPQKINKFVREHIQVQHVVIPITNAQQSS